MLRTTRGWPMDSASSMSVLAVGRCRMCSSSANEPQLMVMPANSSGIAVTHVCARCTFV